jgi:geranylgeranyl reductase
MLAFSAQEWLLEPLAGTVFALSPASSARLAGLQNAGVVLGMLIVVAAAVIARQPSPRFAQHWMIGGTLASAGAVATLAAMTILAALGWLPLAAFALGVANGLFAVAAVSVMMNLAASAGAGREGLYMGLWGAAQALAFATGGLGAGAIIDGVRPALGAPAAFTVLLCLDAVLFLLACASARGLRLSAARPPITPPGGDPIWDVVVIGGGPAGATAAHELAHAGHRVLLIDRAGRIKPCGGAVPPRLLQDFEIPDQLVVARVNRARMVSPSLRHVDMPIESGTVGMVDREVFDEWLRERARLAGCERRDGEVLEVACSGTQDYRIHYRSQGASSQETVSVRARSVIGADGAASRVARQRLADQGLGAARGATVAAYHEVIRTPAGVDGRRCEVWYNGRVSPDFYGWVFPHGETLSVGVGSARKGFSLRRATTLLRAQAGLAGAETLRCEGAPIPLRPLRRWDDGVGMVLAGDAAGVVAPASGEGIYYAMYGGRLAARGIGEFLSCGDPQVLRQVRRRFLREHGRVFWILRMMQGFWYRNDARRERFVSICRDPDVQHLTWQAYLHKKLVRARPLAHARIFFKDLAHLLHLARI